MKKRIAVVDILAVMALVLSGCASQARSAQSAPTAPTETAIPSPPSPIPVRTATPAPIYRVATARPLVTATFAPTLTPRSVTPVAPFSGMGSLVFSCNQNLALCLVNADGTNLRQIAPGGEYIMPRWSPDGQVFAAVHLPYAYSGGDEVQGPMNTTGEIALFSAEGEQLATFSPGGAYLLSWADLAWSPNGKWLAFVTAPDRNGNGLADPDEPGEIWILDRERFELAFSVLQSGVLEWTPAWSSDSRWLAFGHRASTAALDSDETEVWVFDAQQRQVRVVAKGNEPTWMPQSERFAFVNAVRTELRVAGVTIKREQTLVTERDVHNFLACDDPWLPKGKLSFRWPAWSPDGSTIAFRVWGESEEPWPRYFPGMLFTIGADGTNLQRWPDTDSPNTGLQVWSPRGDRLAYIYWMAGDGRYYPDPATPAPERRFTYKKCCSGLITADLKKGNWWDEPGPLSTDLQPFGSWSSDGKWLVTRANYPQTGLVVFSVENPERRWTFSDLDVDEVQWQPMSR